MDLAATLFSNLLLIFSVLFRFALAELLVFDLTLKIVDFFKIKFICLKLFSQLTTCFAFNKLVEFVTATEVFV